VTRHIIAKMNIWSWLSLQDFAFESDGQRMRKAAHLMVTSLAGSMALVSCRDAMRTSLSSQLRALLSDLTGAAAIEEEVCTQLLHACAFHGKNSGFSIKAVAGHAWLNWCKCQFKPLYLSGAFDYCADGTKVIVWQVAYH
jgi:hypothetical protein